MAAFLVKIAAFSALLFCSTVTQTTCGEKEILSNGTQWEHTCETEIIDEKFKSEEGKCICTNGLVRDANGACVTRKECERQMCDELRQIPFDSADQVDNKQFPQCRNGETCAVIRVKVQGNLTEPATADRWSFIAGCI